ncbi:MAG: transporter substrate-binding domain-containing protein [Cyanobacteria bacterium]|nr:transporter substrate-binding domain-containing protein [Cyanobacteriota bacterium]
MTCLPRGGRSWPPTRVCRGWLRAVQVAVGPRFVAMGSALLALGLVPLAPTQAARSETILRVGVLDGSPPCSELRGPGRWEGKAVELWHFVAARERLAYTLEPYPNAKALLEASRRGAVDLGVGCLTITPERVGTYRFSLPFQESGVALLMGTSRLATLRAVLEGLLDARLLGLLAGYLLAIGVLSLVVWRTEGGYPPGSAMEAVSAAGSAARSKAGRAGLWPTRDGWRQRALVFQVLATGPGTNTIVVTTRGQGLVVLSYLLRIVFGSLIVSTITLDVLRQAPLSDALPDSLDDLAGRRVAARPGSVSEKLLRSPPLQGRVTVVPLPKLSDASDLLLNRQVDAVLADEQQLRYVREQLSVRQRSRLQLVLDGQRPESQAFVYSPQLPKATSEGIDRAISEAKRNGQVP